MKQSEKTERLIETLASQYPYKHDRHEAIRKDGKNVALASHVTAYARIYLWGSNQKRLKARGGRKRIEADLRQRSEAIRKDGKVVYISEDPVGIIENGLPKQSEKTERFEYCRRDVEILSEFFLKQSEKTESVYPASTSPWCFHLLVCEAIRKDGKVFLLRLSLGLFLSFSVGSNQKRLKGDIGI